jgi:hypothetical protein
LLYPYTVEIASRISLTPACGINNHGSIPWLNLNPNCLPNAITLKARASNCEFKSHNLVHLSIFSFVVCALMSNLICHYLIQGHEDLYLCFILRVLKFVS